MPIYDLVFLVIAHIIGCVYASLVVCYWIVGFIKSPFTFFACKKRDVAPECLTASDLGTHCFVHLEEVRLHYVTAGDEKKPLMLFLHGFPEFWYSWRYQLKEFQKDYRVVAVDMRGYGDSDKPSGVSSYKMSKLISDIKQLVPALGHRSCILVAHDWGGAVAWQFSALHPELVDKLIVMNCPHPGIFRDYMEKHFSQFLSSWYIYFFQVPFLPELGFRVKDMGSLSRILKGKQSGLTVGKMSNEDLEAYKYAFSRPGVKTAAINYYRAALRYPFVKLPKITCPVLTVWGCKDTALEKGLASAVTSVVDNHTLKYIEDASHFVQIDTPDIVNQHMRDFLKTA